MEQEASSQIEIRPDVQRLHQIVGASEFDIAHVVAILPLVQTPHVTLLDVGVGTGSGIFSVAIARHIRDGYVIAVDLDRDTLLEARDIATKVGARNIAFQQADVLCLPFPDATFDITCCYQVLLCIDFPPEALREMMRVTKPGRFVIARESDFTTQCI